MAEKYQSNAFEFDADWLKRSLTELYSDEMTVQEKSNKILEILKIANDNEACEKNLLLLLGIDRLDFIRLIKENREKILYCTSIAQTDGVSFRKSMERMSLDSIPNSSMHSISTSSNVSSVTNANVSLETVEFDNRTKVLNRLVHRYASKKLSKVTLEFFIDVINDIDGLDFELPKQAESVLKEYKDKCGINAFFHILCIYCDEYVKFNFEEKQRYVCQKCNAVLPKTNSAFVSIEIKQQLKKIIRDNYKGILEYRETILTQNNDIISDVYNGEVIKEMCKEEYPFCLMISTDGVKVHNSGTKSLWPILLAPLFLNPIDRYRQENMILAGLYFGDTEHKPHFNDFFDPICEEMLNYSLNGLTIQCETSKFFVTHATADAPARANLLNQTSHSGYYACCKCQISGEHLDGAVHFPSTTIVKGDDKLWCNLDMMLAMDVASNSKEPKLGFHGPSCLTNFEKFDLWKGVGFDYMHLALEGATKHLLTLWFNASNHNEKYYIQPKDKEILNERLKNIRPCRSFRRTPTNFQHMLQFKASEYRMILLYYYPIFKYCIKENYYKHFELLASSIYKLNQAEISTKDLNDAEKNLNQFVSEFETLYGRGKVTLNIHSLKHLTECVRQLGPLWSYSLFYFEGFNSKLKDYVNQDQHTLFQIVNKFILEREYPPEKNIEIPFVHHLNTPIKVEFTPEESSLLSLMNIDIRILSTFAAWKISAQSLYTSLNYLRSEKKIDYFVDTKGEQFGKIKYFFEHNNMKYAMIKEYKSIHTSYQIIQVTKLDKSFVCRCEEIDNKYIYLKFASTEFIVRPANKIEPN